MRMLIAVLLVASVVMAACQPVSVEQATTDYCQSLQAFHASVLAVQGLDENSTIDEVEAAFALVEDSYRDVQQAGSILTEAELDALDQAYEDLSNVSREIEGSMTLGEAKGTVDESVAAVDAAWEQLYADAGCVSAAAE
jgi:hypothetical protein